jgi:hypothetical protein
MAETKQAKPKKSRSKSSSKKASAGSSSKAKSSAKANGSKASGAKDKAGKAASSASSNGANHGIVPDGIGPIVQKAKLPLLAGGAAVAGVAGAVLASRSGGKRKVLGVSVPKRSKLSMPDLPKTKDLKSDARKVTGAVTAAAKRADTIGQGVSKIASSVQKVGESADEAVKKN